MSCAFKCLNNFFNLSVSKKKYTTGCIFYLRNKRSECSKAIIKTDFYFPEPEFLLNFVSENNSNCSGKCLRKIWMAVSMNLQICLSLLTFLKSNCCTLLAVAILKISPSTRRYDLVHGFGS